MTATVRTNIFGDFSGTSSIGSPPFSTSETTAAGKLIDKLKWIADSQINKVDAGVDWLGLAADAGQNTTADGFVRRQHVRPDRLTSSSILSGWVNPAMPALPTFPTLPAELQIDMNSFRTRLDDEVNRLKTSWMAQYLPPISDMSRFDTLSRDILNGVDDDAAKAILTSLHATLKAALQNITGVALGDLNTAIATSKTNLATNIAGVQPKIDAALALARGDTQNIAWARARDQIAREAARLETEAAEEVAARGFPLPTGVLTGVTAKARQDALDAAAKAAGDEAVRAQQQYLDIAKIAVTSWLQAGELQLKSEIEGFTAYMDQRLKYAAMELDANREVAKQSVEYLGLRLDFTKFGADFALKYRMGCMDSMNGLINAYANLAGNEMQYLARIADAQRGNLQALIDYFRAALSYSDMGLRAAITNNDNDVRWAQIAAQFIGTAVGHHVQAAAATADVYARVAGMAMSGLNGVASVAASG